MMTPFAVHRIKLDWSAVAGLGVLELDTLISASVLVQPRKIHPNITEK